MTIIQHTHSHTQYHIDIHNVCHFSFSIVYFFHRKIRVRKVLFIRSIHNTLIHSLTHSHPLIELFAWVFVFLLVSVSLFLFTVFGQYRSKHVIRLSTFVWVWAFPWNGFAFSFVDIVFFSEFQVNGFLFALFSLQTHSYTYKYVYRKQFIDCVDLKVPRKKS